MRITEGADIYLDANFLVAYFVSGGNSDGDINKKAQTAMAEMLSKNCNLYLSPLVFDEFWNGIKREKGVKSIRNKIRFYGDKFIREYTFFNGLSNRGATYYGHFELYSELEKYTTKLASNSKVKVVSYDRPLKATKNALKNIQQYQMKPRDSFHLSLLEQKGIPFILTRDTKFLDLEDNKKVDGINFMDLN